MKTIQLPHGKVTLVDDDDYEHLNRFRWHFGSGYAVKWLTTDKNKGRSIAMHNYIIDVPPGLWVDHANGDRLDNRKENLRLATPQQNARNRSKTSRKKSSVYRGVSWNKTRTSYKKWNARINAGHGNINLGYFAEESEAAKAYDEAARRYFGEFAKVNFQEGE
jgi:hypothetical protein